MKKTNLTYKQAVAEIDEILNKLENEEPDVDELSEKVKRVSELIRYCREKLKNTEKEVENILKDIGE